MTSLRPSAWFWRNIAAPFVATRLMLVAVGYLTLLVMQHPGVPQPWEIGADGMVRQLEIPKAADPFSVRDHWFANIFARWDSGWYLGIAEGGYRYQPGEESNVAFFPLYPAIMALAKPLFGQSAAATALAGIFISNVSLLAAMTLLASLVRRDFDEDIAARVVGYLLIYPATHFFSAVYTESVFLLWTVGTFYFARRAQWWWAGSMAALAAVTRFQGIAVAAALALEYFHQRGFRWREVRVDVLALLLPALAFAADMAWMWERFGDPLVRTHAQGAWNHQFRWPWLLLGRGARDLLAHGLEIESLDFLAISAFSVLTVLAWRRLRPSYSLYATLSLAMLLCSGVLASSVRYMIVIFPAFILLAQAGRHAIFDRCYVPISTGLAALFASLFVLWRWVG